MLLKPDRTGRSDRGPARGPVQRTPLSRLKAEPDRPVNRPDRLNRLNRFGPGWTGFIIIFYFLKFHKNQKNKKKS